MRRGPDELTAVASARACRYWADTAAVTVAAEAPVRAYAQQPVPDHHSVPRADLRRVCGRRPYPTRERADRWRICEDGSEPPGTTTARHHAALQLRHGRSGRRLPRCAVASFCASPVNHGASSRHQKLRCCPCAAGLDSPIHMAAPPLQPAAQPLWGMLSDSRGPP